MIARALYRGLILLHPPAFRRRFADEMMWIFEEASRESGTRAFLVDGLSSLVRQWSVRPLLWKILAIGLGNLPFLFLGLLPRTHHPRTAVSVFAAPDFFVLVALASLVAISIGLIFAVGWFRFVQGRRTWSLDR